MGLLSQVAPDFVKGAYRQSRLILRAASRMLGPGSTSCRVRDIVVKIGISSEVEQFRANSYSTKEPETLDWLDRELRENDVFFDIGANIGLYSLYAAKVNPRCIVFAFEPESQNYSRLCNNIFLNGVTNIVPCSFPLSDREVFDYFYVSSMEPGSSLHSLGGLSDFRKDSTAGALRQGVLSTTLDALVGKHGIPQPTLLKIDVDGIEDRILDGAAMVLGSEKLRTVLVEFNFHDSGELGESVCKMTSFGYKLARKSDWVWEQNGFKSQNCIFCRT